MVQWLRLYASTARGRGPIPGWGTKILNAAQCGQKKKNKKKENKKNYSALDLGKYLTENEMRNWNNR